MYTNAGILAMLKLSEVLANYAKIKEELSKAEEGALVMDPETFTDLVRWETDLHAHIVGWAERTGRTNVRGAKLSF